MVKKKYYSARYTYIIVNYNILWKYNDIIIQKRFNIY